MVNTAALKGARVAAGYTQEAAGKLINVSKNTYSEKENNKAKFDIVEAEILCGAFGIIALDKRAEIFLFNPSRKMG